MSSSGRTNRIYNAAFIQNRQTIPVKTPRCTLCWPRHAVWQFLCNRHVCTWLLGAICVSFLCDVNAIFILCRLCMKQRKTLFDLFQSAIRMKHSRQHLHIDRVTEVTAVFENEKEEEEQKKQHTQLSDYNLSFFFSGKCHSLFFHCVPFCNVIIICLPFYRLLYLGCFVRYTFSHPLSLSQSL